MRRRVWLLVLSVAVLAAAGCTPPVPSFDVTGSWDYPTCRVEKVTYLSEGRRIVGWVVTPKRPGPFPILVWNHGSNVAPGGIESDIYAWTQGAGCREDLTDGQWLLFLPEGRGYGGSEGPRPITMMTIDGTAAFLRGRADDANAGLALLEARPEARKGCAVVMGVSHGGVVSILASESGRYRAVIAQASGMSYRDPLLGIREMDQAMRHSGASILLQHAANDHLVSPASSRTLFDLGQQAGLDATYQEYPGLNGLEGHTLFSMSYAANIWRPDFVKHRDRAAAACP